MSGDMPSRVRGDKFLPIRSADRSAIGWMTFGQLRFGMRPGGGTPWQDPQYSPIISTTASTDGGSPSGISDAACPVPDDIAASDNRLISGKALNMTSSYLISLLD